MHGVDGMGRVRLGRDWVLPILQVQLYVAVDEDRGGAVSAASGGSATASRGSGSVLRPRGRVPNA
ncbi:hypothetical protein GCM10018962_36400 [Dactylosporangium matsuzakiense]|uniref:Uncharacterized protein n=1 Tax=Dactylosporangium matsuzakiense TaxID=53360 RepID=A0A9W6KSL5_9ACTN|nr:hypothetical protein GCM10017581_065110 [Dactylosporangium matsuzakiense]